MRMLGAVLTVQTSGGPEAIIISPTDDVWFVKEEACPPETKQWLEETLKDARRDLLGFIFIGDAWKHPQFTTSPEESATITPATSGTPPPSSGSGKPE